MKIDNFQFYTGSMISLGWVRGINREFKHFVQNDHKEIRRVSDISSWHYVAGIYHISDISSKFSLPSKLREHS